MQNDLLHEGRSKLEETRRTPSITRLEALIERALIRRLSVNRLLYCKNPRTNLPRSFSVRAPKGGEAVAHRVADILA